MPTVATPIRLSAVCCVSTVLPDGTIPSSSSFVRVFFVKFCSPCVVLLPDGLFLVGVGLFFGRWRKACGCVATERVVLVVVGWLVQGAARYETRRGCCCFLHVGDDRHRFCFLSTGPH